MLGFALTFGAIVGSFLLPAIAGMMLISLAAKFTKVSYIAAFVVGIYLWFFSDTIGDATYLGLQESYGGGFFHFALWLLFAIGLILMITLDKDLFTSGPSGERLGFMIPVLVALAVGIHGFGEGAGIGATAALTPTTNIIDAFGGLAAAVAFILHKGLEPMMVGAAYWLYCGERAKDSKKMVRDILVLAAIFVLPGIVGGASAYFIVQIYPNADFTYVFALGLGTSIYALLRLARPLYYNNSDGKGHESLKYAVAILLGFTCLYLAALLHS